jgi:hypothetical protein
VCRIADKKDPEWGTRPMENAALWLVVPSVLVFRPAFHESPAAFSLIFYLPSTSDFAEVEGLSAC